MSSDLGLPSFSNFIMAVLMDHTRTATGVVDAELSKWFIHMPESSDIHIRDADGNAQSLDIVQAIEMFHRDHGSWYVPTDVSGATTDLSQLLGFDLESVYSNITQSISAYHTSLKEANDTHMQLLTYSRRLDAAHAWAVLMPDAIRTEDSVGTVQGEIREYLRNLGNGILLRETLDRYGKASLNCARLHAMFEYLREISNAVLGHTASTTQNATFNVEVQSTTVGIDTVSVLASQPIDHPTSLQCRQCNGRLVYYVMVPCGHMTCLLCSPIGVGAGSCQCPLCDRDISSRVRINFS
jgi:hypothetical protein